MIDRGCGLSLSRQCALLGVSRSSQYRPPAGESAENLALMRRLDELHLAHPFYGSRQMARHPRREGVVAGRHRVRRLMRLMGMEAIYRKPRTSAPNPQHRVYPYLHRGAGSGAAALRSGRYAPSAQGRRGHLYFGEKGTFLLWFDSAQDRH